MTTYFKSIFVLLVLCACSRGQTLSGGIVLGGGGIAPSTFINVKTYGALGNGKVISDGAMSSGSTTLTSATAAFTSGDAGKLICVAGAAANTTELCTTIATFTNSTTVVLSASNASGGAISSSEFVYATDDSAAVTTALAAACGNVLFFPPGIYGSSAVEQTPCTTNSTSIVGSGNAFPDYNWQGHGITASHGGNTVSALWFLTKSMSANLAGIHFGNGLAINDNVPGVANYRYPTNVESISIFAGLVGTLSKGGGDIGNRDGACSTCNGLWFNATSRINVANVTVAGWGQDGIHITQAWGVKIFNSLTLSNGRYGNYVDNFSQQIMFDTMDSSRNGWEGIYITLSSGITVSNSMIQWNNVSGGGGHYELRVTGEGTTAVTWCGSCLVVTGNWFEGGGASAAIFVGADTIDALCSANVFNGYAVQDCKPLTTVSGSTSGTAVFGQPDQKTSRKTVTITASSLVGTASYTFPIAFTNTPSCVATSTLACAVLTNISTTAVTITGSTSTGFITLVGY